MKRSIKFFITVIISIFMILSAFFITGRNITENKFSTIYEEPIETKNPNPDFEQIVYVTHSGTKYHKRSCEFILGHSVKAYKKSQAEELGFEPCYNCMQD